METIEHTSIMHPVDSQAGGLSPGNPDSPQTDDQSGELSSHTSDDTLPENDNEDVSDDENPSSFDCILTSFDYATHVYHRFRNHFTAQDGFRELVQNWRDAIIDTNKLAEKDFCVRREAVGELNGEAAPPYGRTEIVYKAFSREESRSPECLGFIRYVGLDGEGTVEISNFGAALQDKHLVLGGGTKKDRQDQAGQHGDGLIVGILALMRHDANHQVICRSSNLKLTFAFKAGCLHILADRISAPGAKQPRPPAIATPEVNPGQDVQFIIGEAQRGQNERGRLIKKSPVRQGVFKSWTQSALFLTEVHGGEESIVSTSHGDLLTSEDQRGKIYLKGLLVPDYRGINGCAPGFGYNFLSGETGMYARALLTPEEDQLTTICAIVCEALTMRPGLELKVCDVINSYEPKYAEGLCSSESWPRDIALLVDQDSDSD